MFKKTSFVFMLAIIIGKITGFLREVTLAHYFGTSFISDAYIIATNIPEVIFLSIGIALSTSFISVYTSLESKEGKKNTVLFTNHILKIVFLISFILTIVGTILSSQLVSVFAIGFDEQTKNFTASFVRILLPSLLFIGISNVQGSFLQVNKKFTVFGFASVPTNIVVIISIVLANYFNQLAFLSWGTLISYVSMSVYYLPYMYKSGFRIKKKTSSVINEYSKKMFRLMGPIFLSVSVNQINLLIDRALASGLEQGTITSMNYADKIRGMVMGVFVTSISLVVYPKLSTYFSKGNMYKFQKSSLEAVEMVLLMVTPIIFYILFFSRDIVRVIFQRGAFDTAATELTSNILFFFALGLLGYSLVEVTNRIFYSLQDTRTPMFVSIGSIIINIILNFSLINFFGAGGLALANSVSSVLAVIVSLILLTKKLPYFNLRGLLAPFALSGILSFCLFGTGNFVLKFVDSRGKSTLYFLIISLVTWGIYCACLFFKRIKGNERNV